MDLIRKYIGQEVDQEKVDEVLGKGYGHVLSKVKGADIKKLEGFLKKSKIPYTKDSKSGSLVVGDDDFDEVEELMVRKLGIF